MTKKSAFRQAFDRETDGLIDLSSGVCSLCPECCSAYGMEPEELETALETGKVSEEGSFSRSRCDTCGQIAGDRYASHARIEGKNAVAQIVHLDVCPDCLVYIANGK